MIAVDKLLTHKGESLSPEVFEIGGQIGPMLRTNCGILTDMLRVIRLLFCYHLSDSLQNVERNAEIHICAFMNSCQSIHVSEI